MGIPGRISCRHGSGQPGSTGRRSLFGRHQESSSSSVMRTADPQSSTDTIIHLSYHFDCPEIDSRCQQQELSDRWNILWLPCRGCLIGDDAWSFRSFVNDFLSPGPRQRSGYDFNIQLPTRSNLCMHILCDGGFNDARPNIKRASEIWCGTRRVGAKVANHCPTTAPRLAAMPVQEGGERPVPPSMKQYVYRWIHKKDRHTTLILWKASTNPHDAGKLQP
jgi:hypothetical protein